MTTNDKREQVCNGKCWWSHGDVYVPDKDCPLHAPVCTVCGGSLSCPYPTTEGVEAPASCVRLIHGTPEPHEHDFKPAELDGPCEVCDCGAVRDWKPETSSRVEAHIWIDSSSFGVELRSYTGAELRYLPTPALRDDVDLWLSRDPLDAKVEVDDEVRLRDGMRFFTAPAIIAPGSAPAQEPTGECVWDAELGLFCFGSEAVEPHIDWTPERMAIEYNAQAQRIATLTEERDEAVSARLNVLAEVEAMDVQATKLGEGDWIEGYQFKTGAWHRFLGLARNESGIIGLIDRAEAAEAKLTALEAARKIQQTNKEYTEGLEAVANDLGTLQRKLRAALAQQKET